jgi:hypothetical protein
MAYEVGFCAFGFGIFAIYVPSGYTPQPSGTIAPLLQAFLFGAGSCISAIVHEQIV